MGTEEQFGPSFFDMSSVSVNIFSGIWRVHGVSCRVKVVSCRVIILHVSVSMPCRGHGIQKNHLMRFLWVDINNIMNHLHPERC